MFGLNMLDVLIGLVFLYFLLSITASAVVEGISGWFKLRNTLLERTVRSLLDGSGAAPGAGSADKLIAHPLIAPMIAKSGQWPAYLASQTFSSALLDLIAPPGISSGRRRSFWAIRDAVLGRDPDGRVDRKVDLAEHGTLQAALQGFVETATAHLPDGTPEVDVARLDLLRGQIEKWFDDTMERTSGWYKRRVQLLVLLVAAVLAGVLNIDSISIAQRLASDREMRNKLVSAASSESAGYDAAGHIENDKLKANWHAVAEAGLPLGWTAESDRDRLSSWYWPTKAGGLLVTIFATLMGAPFWFDLLGKLVNLRSAGNKPAASAGTPLVERSTDGGTPKIGSGSSPAGPSLPPAPSETSPPAEFVFPDDYWSRPARREDLGALETIPAGGLTLRLAGLMSRASLLAYQTPSTIEQVLTQSWSVASADFKVVSLGGHQVIAFAAHDAVVIAFRGTVPAILETIIADAKIMLVPFLAGNQQPGQVHRGFLDAVKLLDAELQAFVSPHIDKGRRLFVTGHSLGAAMATLYAARLVGNKPGALGGLCTFGSPRVGNDAFVNWLSPFLGTLSWRFVNNQDVVTRVAPREFGYEHLKQVMFVDADGRLDPVGSGWVRFLNTVIDAAADFKRAAQSSLGDHRMELYVRRLDNLASS